MLCSSEHQYQYVSEEKVQGVILFQVFELIRCYIENITDYFMELYFSVGLVWFSAPLTHATRHLHRSPLRFFPNVNTSFFWGMGHFCSTLC